MDKIPRMRFTTKDDICLLKEVAEYKPFENIGQWNAIQDRLAAATGKCYSIRTLRDHVDHLLKLFVKNDVGNLRKSGTQTQFEEKEKLLQDIKILWTEYKRDNQRKKTKPIRSPPTTVKSETDTGFQDDDITLEYNITLPKEDPFLTELNETQIQITSTDSNHSTQPSQSNSDSYKPKKSWKRKNTLPILYDNLKWEKVIRRKNLLLQEKKLILEERRLQLEQEKFELEKNERGERLRIEVKERENNILISQQQQNIISFFIQNFKKS